MNAFHYDYHSLRGGDVSIWQDDFFWPVARETTHDIAVTMHRLWQQLCDEAGETVHGDCLTCGIFVPIMCAQILNHALVAERLMAWGGEVRFGSGLKFFPRLMDGGALRLAAWDLRASVQEPPLMRKIKIFFKSAEFNFRRSSCGLWDHLASGDRVYSFPNANVIERNHVRRSPSWVRLTSPEEWLDPLAVSSPDAALALALDESAARMLLMVVEFARGTLALELPRSAVEALGQYVCDTLRNIGACWPIVMRCASRHRASHLFTPTGGNPFIRLVSLAVRRTGGRVIGHPHGYFICHHMGERHCMQELATVDAFMAYTVGSVGLFRRNLAIHHLPRGNSCEILHDNYHGLVDVWRQYVKADKPTRINRVMILELSIATEWAGFNCAETMVNYEFYVSLCRTLIANGYEVVFKKRPKSRGWEGINIFERMPGVTVEERPFEDPGVIDSVDAVVIQYGMSSTLNYSMCTNKTIIYVDAGWDLWFPDVYEKMARRCRVLHCWYDERNRCRYDEEELLALLDKPPEDPDTAFMESYLFPEGVKA